jgi:hypothetical protein
MNNNTAPTTTGSPSPATTPADANGGTHPNDEQFDAGSALLRLLLGGMLVGTHELRERVRRWEDSLRAAQAGQAAPSGQSQDTSASMRRALIGAAFEAQERMRRGFSDMLARIAEIADDANLAYTRLTFAVRGTPLDAARGRLDELLFLASTAVDRWTERGRVEEQDGRQVAEQAAISVIDELLVYMARNPEVRKLIEQQGTSMAESAVGEVRERSASADQWIERITHNLLHRPVGDSPAKPADGRGVLPPTEDVPASPGATPKTRTRAAGAQTRTPAPMGDAQMTHSSDPE